MNPYCIYILFTQVATMLLENLNKFRRDYSCKKCLIVHLTVLVHNFTMTTLKLKLLRIYLGNNIGCKINK